MCNYYPDTRSTRQPTNLSFFVDTNGTTACVSDKDGLSIDVFYVDAVACLLVIEMYIAKLEDKVDPLIIGVHLKVGSGRKEIVEGRRKIKENEIYYSIISGRIYY